MWIVDSTGTGPISASGGQPQINWLARGTATVNTAATLSLVSANAGEHYVELSASEVSCLGVASVQYRSATAIPSSTYFQIVNYDSGDSMRFGQMSLPNFAASAASGLLVLGTGVGGINASSGSVAPLYADYSSKVTVGVGIAAPSLVTVRLEAVDYSSVVTVGVGIAAPSLVTVRLSAVNYSSVVTVGVGIAAPSLVTVRLSPVDYSSVVTVGVGNILPANYSGVSMEVLTGGIKASSFGASSIDAAALATDAGQEIADRILLRSIAGGADTGTRTVQNALRAIRNKVDASSSVMTVFQENDSTSAWTASLTTAATNVGVVSIVDQGGRA